MGRCILLPGATSLLHLIHVFLSKIRRWEGLGETLMFLCQTTPRGEGVAVMPMAVRFIPHGDGLSWSIHTFSPTGLSQGMVERLKRLSFTLGGTVVMRLEGLSMLPVRQRL